MELVNTSPSDIGITDPGYAKSNATEMEVLLRRFDEETKKFDKIQQKADEFKQFFESRKHQNTSKGGSKLKDKEKEKPITSIVKQQQDREEAAAKRMQELMRNFATILRQITQHKWAWPFMDPVDVKGLGLHDYHKVIEKPMDFSKIKQLMEAKDETAYKNVREICADVRLIFKNAMKYNDEKNDIHIMAKTLLAKFEEKWFLFLPKVVEEEKRREKEEAEAQLNIERVQGAANFQMNKYLSIELEKIEKNFLEIRRQMLQRTRKWTTEDKRILGMALSKLSPEDLNKALEIVAKNNPTFEASADEVDLDLDAQSESTLWSLKFFVLKVRKNSPSNNNDTNNGSNNNSNSKNKNDADDENSKRKKEICDALARTAKKRSKKAS